MINKKSRTKNRVKKHYRIRNRVKGTAERPRLCVFRSNSHIYAQIIDDVAGNTLVAAGTTEKAVAAEVAKETEHTDNVAAAAVLGDVIAKRAIKKGIQTVVFDRGGYIYHGKVAAVAKAARDAGLVF